MMTYKLTAIAKKDIQHINHYSVKQWGKAQAIDYVTALYQRFDWLAHHPHWGRTREDIKPNLMSYRENSHVIFYRMESDDSIAVLRVLHVRMDVKQHL